MSINSAELKLRKQFGKRIRDLRKEKGWSQEDFGFRAEIHRTYIGAVERGEQNVSLDNIGRLSRTLRIDLREMFNF